MSEDEKVAGGSLLALTHGIAVGAGIVFGNSGGVHDPKHGPMLGFGLALLALSVVICGITYFWILNRGGGE